MQSDYEFGLTERFTPPLAATTTVNGQEILAIALHPSPSRLGAMRIYERQAKLRSVERMVAIYDGPAVIIADLNIAPTSPQYQQFLEELEWQDPRHVVGIEPTYGTRGLGLAIDHIFVSPELQVHEYDVGPAGGSDHQSLTATVSWVEQATVAGP